VLASRSVPTLIACLGFPLGAFLFQGLLDGVRARVVVAVAGLLYWRLETIVREVTVRPTVRREMELT
jgi:ABC-type protease/lipase transport system fused ATPase/permease subunit